MVLDNLTLDLTVELLSSFTGQQDSEKMRQLEEKIQSLTKSLQALQSTMNERFQQEANKPGLRGGGPSSGGRNPADAAQPEIKETIHSIQTKLDQLDNRTQVSQSSARLKMAITLLEQ